DDPADPRAGPGLPHLRAGSRGLGGHRYAEGAHRIGGHLCRDHRLASGAIACCYATVSAHRTANGFDVFGQLGSVHYPWNFECMDRTWREEALRAVLGVHPPAPEPEESAHTPYLRAVLDAIDAGRPLPIGPDEARASLELCVAL